MRWRAFPLHPETPKEGRSLAELFRTQQPQIEAMIERLRLTAENLGLPFGERTRTYNSRLAQELGLWAEECKLGDQFHMGAFKAYFADGLNLAKEEVLTTLAGDIGLDTKKAVTVLKTRSYRDAVDRDWQRSRDLGIRAVPTFVMNTNQLVGAQPYQALVEMVEQQGVLKRDLQ